MEKSFNGLLQSVQNSLLMAQVWMISSRMVLGTVGFYRHYHRLQHVQNALLLPLIKKLMRLLGKIRRTLFSNFLEWANGNPTKVSPTDALFWISTVIKLYCIKWIILYPIVLQPCQKITSIGYLTLKRRLQSDIKPTMQLMVDGVHGLWPI